VQVGAVDSHRSVKLDGHRQSPPRVLKRPSKASRTRDQPSLGHSRARKRFPQFVGITGSSEATIFGRTRMPAMVRVASRSPRLLSLKHQFQYLPRTGGLTGRPTRQQNNRIARFGANFPRSEQLRTLSLFLRSGCRRVGMVSRCQCGGRRCHGATARAHFVVRRLERRYGKDAVRAAYDRFSNQASAAA
jgi:hypothetical protein